MAEPRAHNETGRTARSTVVFFAAAFGITWTLQLPALLAWFGFIPGPVASYLPLVGLGAFGPLPAALLAARSEPGSGGARALFRKLSEPRPRLSNVLLALCLPGAILSVGLIVTSLGNRDAPWFYPPHNAQQILALLLIPVGEELGWRGFAQPRLEAQLGALRASLVLGALWALWHFPVFTLVGIAPSTLPWMFPFFMAGSVLFTWLYHRGGLLLAVLAHAGAHLNNSHQALPANTTPLIVHTVGYAVVALALVLVDRKTFRA